MPVAQLFVLFGRKCLFRSFAHFKSQVWKKKKSGLFVFLMLGYTSPTNIYKYFLPFNRLSFCFAVGFFAMQKHLSLVTSHLFIFAFISFDLGNRLKKYCYDLHQSGLSASRVVDLFLQQRRVKIGKEIWEDTLCGNVRPGRKFVFPDRYRKWILPIPTHSTIGTTEQSLRARPVVVGWWGSLHIQGIQYEVTGWKIWLDLSRAHWPRRVTWSKFGSPQHFYGQ